MSNNIYTYQINRSSVISRLCENLYKNRDKLTSVHDDNKINLKVEWLYMPEKETDSWFCPFELCYGQYYFKVGDDNTIEINYYHNNKPVKDNCATCIDYFKTLEIKADNEEKFLEFYKTYITEPKHKQSNKLYIYIPNKYGEWTIYNNIPKRSIDSIYLDEKIKDKIICDIRNFMENEKEYDRFGIPYKRTYMLTGIPGSGKTSMIKAICNQIGYSLSLLSLQKEFDNNSLLNAFRSLEKNTILLLEDIDCIFQQRKSSSDNPLISFSSLINILDGVLYKHGIIIFITTNHPETLDHALMRMGRIDMIVQLNYPREQDIRKLFFDLNEKHPIDEEKESTYKKFYDSIKGKKITMSAIVNFLFSYRMKCLDNIKELIETNEFLTHLSGEDSKDKLYN